MQNFTLAGVVLLGLAIVAGGALSAGRQEDAVAALERRVADLERIILRDANDPRRTVLARVEAIERRLDERARDEERDGRVLRDDRAALDRRLDQLTRGQQEIERRLRALEADRGGANVERELQQLQRDQQSIERTLRDLADRVRRVEGR
jgi:hypothetical protein